MSTVEKSEANHPYHNLSTAHKLQHNASQESLKEPTPVKLPRSQSAKVLRSGHPSECSTTPKVTRKVDLRSRLHTMSVSDFINTKPP